ncbi:MAG: YbjP/YqhG family protein [Acidobacteriota bacterium]|nr:YbjP/YqhG family protein [Acidobacteriota bacterium]
MRHISSDKTLMLARVTLVAGSLLVVSCGASASAVNNASATKNDPQLEPVANGQQHESEPVDVNGADAEMETGESPAPNGVARQFYAWFIKAGYPEPTTHKAQFRRYVTQACLKKAINADDYVYFTQAQDGDPSWGTHISVTVKSNNGERAVVLVTLGKPSVANKLKVQLVKENGAWKINDVDRAA